MHDNKPIIGQAYIARQPIFDMNMQVYAYELLFRDGSSNKSNVDNNIIDGEKATQQLILNAFSELGFENVVGNKLAFINITKSMLMNMPPLPKDKVVLELLENIEVDSSVVEAATKLAKDGYILALDDFIYSPAWDPLIKIAKIIKVDILNVPRDEIARQAEFLSKFGLKLLAEKVETHEECDFCKKLGFHYLQGFFLSRPKLMSAKRASANKMVIMQLLAKLNDPNISLKEIETLLSEDPKLSYKLLKIINSAAYIKMRAIESLNQAVVYLGTQKLKEWAQLIALNSIENKPHELVVSTMIRAKMCELLAIKSGASNKDAYFTTGLFSTLNAMMDEKIEVLMESLPISLEMKRALIAQEGPIGAILKSVIAYERAEWDKLEPLFTTEQYQQAYLTSIEWASDISGLM